MLNGLSSVTGESEAAPVCCYSSGRKRCFYLFLVCTAIRHRSSLFLPSSSLSHTIILVRVFNVSLTCFQRIPNVFLGMTCRASGTWRSQFHRHPGVPESQLVLPWKLSAAFILAAPDTCWFTNCKKIIDKLVNLRPCHKMCIMCMSRYHRCCGSDPGVDLRGGRPSGRRDTESGALLRGGDRGHDAHHQRLSRGAPGALLAPRQVKAGRRCAQVRALAIQPLPIPYPLSPILYPLSAHASARCVYICLRNKPSPTCCPSVLSRFVAKASSRHCCILVHDA